jgi:hypothetical protein
MDNHQSKAEQELKLIHETMQQANSVKTGASNYYLIWGIVLFLYFIINYLAAATTISLWQSVGNYSSILFAVGGILSMIQNKRDNKIETVVSFNERVYKYAWIAASIALIAIIFGNAKQPEYGLCLAVLAVFGMVNIIIGGIIKFQPLFIGGLLSVVLSIALNYIPLEYKYLETAIGVLASCIAPALVMKKNADNV